MASTSATSGSSSASNNVQLQEKKIDPFSALKPEDFIKLMITELQNQDPSNPVDNSQILSELSQIGSISTSQQLQTVLSTLATSQGLADARALIGKKIEGIDTSGNQAQGTVAGVVVQDGKPQLIVGQQAVTLDNVQQVISGS